MAVGLGSPYAYALAIGGVEGIIHVLRNLPAEADLLRDVGGYCKLAGPRPDALMCILP